MDCCNKKELEERLKELKTRRAAYISQELYMLNPKGVQSYGIGSRNASRYSLSLKDIRDIIKQLENEIQELENILCGRPIRRAQGVVPRDW